MTVRDFNRKTIRGTAQEKYVFSLHCYMSLSHRCSMTHFEDGGYGTVPPGASNLLETIKQSNLKNDRIEKGIMTNPDSYRNFHLASHLVDLPI